MVGTCDVVNPLTNVKTPTDPTTITFIREEPDGTMTTYTEASPEVAQLATGVWSCTVTVDMAGREIWRFEGSGACIAVAEDAFTVTESAQVVST
jgi:hypothetical protein